MQILDSADSDSWTATLQWHSQAKAEASDLVRSDPTVGPDAHLMSVTDLALTVTFDILSTPRARLVCSKLVCFSLVNPAANSKSCAALCQGHALSIVSQSTERRTLRGAHT